MIELDADHRRHAVCELAIRDLKAGAGLAHLPSGRFAANAAWLGAATLATTCWAGPPAWVWASVTSRPWPRRCGGPCFTCPGGSPAPRGDGRCTCHRLALAHSFRMALARLRCIPYPT